MDICERPVLPPVVCFFRYIMLALFLRSMPSTWRASMNSSNKVWLAVIAPIIPSDATGAFQDLEQALGREARLSSTYRYRNSRWPACCHWFGSVRSHQYDRMYDRRRTGSIEGDI